MNRETDNILDAFYGDGHREDERLTKDAVQHIEFITTINLYQSVSKKGR